MRRRRGAAEEEALGARAAVRGWRARLLVGGGAVAGIATLGAIAYDLLQAARLLPLNSDAVQSFLEARAILAGNVLLRGWRLAADNFYFTDTLPYAAAELVAGERTALLYVLPVLVYLLLVTIASWLAWEAARSVRERVIGIAAVVFLIALPTRANAWFFLVADAHMASIVAALAAFDAIAWHRRVQGSLAKALGALAFLVLSGAASASDPFVIVFALLPLLLVLAAEWLSGVGNDALLPLILTAGALGIGVALPHVLARAGGFRAEPTMLTRFVSADHLGRAIVGATFALLRLAGADIFGADVTSIVGLVKLARLAGLVLIGVVLFTSLRTRRAGARAFLDRVLATACVVTIGASVSSAMFEQGLARSPYRGDWTARYLIPGLIFGAILAARRLPALLGALPTARLRAASSGAIVALAAALVLGHTWQAAKLARAPSWVDANEAREVALWLGRRGLTHGVGDYWATNTVMAFAEHGTTIRPVVLWRGRLRPLAWITDTRWSAAVEEPMFALWRRQDEADYHVNLRTVTATWGRPREVAHVGDFIVAVLGNEGAYRSR